MKRNSDLKSIAAFRKLNRPVDNNEEELLNGFGSQVMEILLKTYASVSAFRDFSTVLMCLGEFTNLLQLQIINTAISADLCHFYRLISVPTPLGPTIKSNLHFLSMHLML
jgi:hypothetical protein